MRAIGRVLDIVAYIVAWISLIGFFFIMMITVIDVIIRLTTGNSILGVYEIVERVMICAVFASFAYCQTQKAHVSITLLIDKYPKRLKGGILGIEYLLSAFAMGITAYAAYKQMMTAISSNYTTGVLYIPVWPFYIVEIVGMIAIGIVFIYDAMVNIGAVFNPSLLEADKAFGEDETKAIAAAVNAGTSEK